MTLLARGEVVFERRAMMQGGRKMATEYEERSRVCEGQVGPDCGHTKHRQCKLKLVE